MNTETKPWDGEFVLDNAEDMDAEAVRILLAAVFGRDLEEERAPE